MVTGKYKEGCMERIILKDLQTNSSSSMELLTQGFTIAYTFTSTGKPCMPQLTQTCTCDINHPSGKSGRIVSNYINPYMMSS